MKGIFKKLFLVGTLSMISLGLSFQAQAKKPSASLPGKRFFTLVIAGGCQPGPNFTTNNCNMNLGDNTGGKVDFDFGPLMRGEEPAFYVTVRPNWGGGFKVRIAPDFEGIRMGPNILPVPPEDADLVSDAGQATAEVIEILKGTSRVHRAFYQRIFAVVSNCLYHAPAGPGTNPTEYVLSHYSMFY